MAIIWCSDFFVIGGTAALVVVVMHTYPPQMRTYLVVTVPCLPQPTQLRVLSYVCCGYRPLPSAADPVACPFLRMLWLLFLAFRSRPSRVSFLSYDMFMLLCLIVPKTDGILEKYVGHKVCASIFSAVFVRNNIFCCDEYLTSFIRDARRNACRSLYEVPVTVPSY
jgi:hypothetical protein